MKFNKIPSFSPILLVFVVILFSNFGISQNYPKQQVLFNEYKNYYKINEQNQITKFYVVVSLLVIVLILGVLFWIKYEREKKILKERISQLEAKKDSVIVFEPVKKEISKKTIIPEETEQVLLGKLKRFERSKRFTNNDISLAVLAGQFETNTKYLSETINKHYGVNFNTYINKLRINYIIEKLKTDPEFLNYKISYLAETCGFSSHSSFATVFKSITGMSPITFIEFLNNEGSDRLEEIENQDLVYVQKE